MLPHTTRPKSLHWGMTDSQWGFYDFQVILPSMLRWVIITLSQVVLPYMTRWVHLPLGQGGWLDFFGDISHVRIARAGSKPALAQHEVRIGVTQHSNCCGLWHHQGRYQYRSHAYRLDESDGKDDRQGDRGSESKRIAVFLPRENSKCQESFVECQDARANAYSSKEQSFCFFRTAKMHVRVTVPTGKSMQKLNKLWRSSSSEQLRSMSRWMCSRRSFERRLRNSRDQTRTINRGHSGDSVNSVHGATLFRGAEPKRSQSSELIYKIVEKDEEIFSRIPKITKRFMQI